MKPLLFSLLLLTGLTASAQKNTDRKAAKTFAQTVLNVCKSGTEKEWQALLNEKYASRGDRFVKMHFEVWKDAFGPVIEQYPDLQKVPVKREDKTHLWIGDVPVSVQKRNGRYYIDEL